MTIEAEPLVRSKAHLGESPVWDHRVDRLVWVDILRGMVHLTDTGDGHTETTQVDRPVGAVALQGKSSYMLALSDGFAVLDGNVVGPVEPLIADPSIRMNDGAVDPAGRFLVGTMAYEKTFGRGTLYSRGIDGTMSILLNDVTVSNGLAWSLTGDLMYYVDSPTQGVDLFTYDVATGHISNRRRHITIETADGVPDGITIDADGFLWVALFGGGRARRYSPSGRIVDEVTTATSNVTSCTFGGPTLDTLFLTTANLGHDDCTLAGAVFAAIPGCLGRRESVIP